MALENIQEQYIPRENSFYRDHYHHILMGLSLLFLLIILANVALLYQLVNKPLPVFGAVKPDGQSIPLTPYDSPNLQPDVITRFAAQAATVAYTFDFANYQDQINAVRPYFTENGWNDYLRSVDALITEIVARQITANGVVTGQPVINNYGDIQNNNPQADISNPNYAWRVAVPFIVTYQSGNGVLVSRSFLVVLTIVKVDTSVNARGIGIDSFVMYPTAGPV